jgi:hypothetical protein
LSGAAADRLRAFAEEARRRLGASLVACEALSRRRALVLYVVEGPAAVRPQLDALHANYAGVNRLAVRSARRSTHEALEWLIAPD